MDSQIDLQKLVTEVVVLAKQASAAVMEIYDAHDTVVDYKADASPVTNADLAANRIIIAGLRELTPTIPIVSEESLDLVADQDFTKLTYWLVDPIDGTKEFIAHNGEFTVNIGLVAAGVPVLGVVDAPALGKTYYAYRGGQAWLQQAGEPLRQIRVADMPKRPRVTISRSHPDTAMQDWLATRQLDIAVRLGSSLKFTAIAEGSADLFPRLQAGVHEWDLAAADAVLREAGGNIWLLSDSQPLQYGRPLQEVPAHLAGGPDATRFINR